MNSSSVSEDLAESTSAMLDYTEFGFTVKRAIDGWIAKRSQMYGSFFVKVLQQNSELAHAPTSVRLCESAGFAEH